MVRSQLAVLLLTPYSLRGAFSRVREPMAGRWQSQQHNARTRDIGSKRAIAVREGRKSFRYAEPCKNQVQYQPNGTYNLWQDLSPSRTDELHPNAKHDSST